MVRVQYWHISLASLLAGLIQFVLLIVICVLPNWMTFVATVAGEKVTANKGIFKWDHWGELFHLTGEELHVIDAMVILSIIALFVGIIAQGISATRRNVSCLGPLALMRLSEALYLLSGTLLVIGLVHYTRYWQSFVWTKNEGNWTWHYSSAYMLACAMSVLFVVFVLAKSVYVNFMLNPTKLISDLPAGVV